MTAWLEFRAEPLSNVPEIDVKMNANAIIHLSCDAADCDWHEYALTPDEMDEKASTHIQWHEEGCPQ